MQLPIITSNCNCLIVNVKKKIGINYFNYLISPHKILRYVFINATTITKGNN